MVTISYVGFRVDGHLLGEDTFNWSYILRVNYKLNENNSECMNNAYYIMGVYYLLID